jgi:Flp pilus assembly protein TadB
MAIDGRSLAERDKKKDAYESRGVKVVSAALVWVPIALLLVLAYVSGTWLGGWTAGMVSLLSAVVTVVVVWLFTRGRRRRG